MGRAFSSITYTPGVRAAQRRYASPRAETPVDTGDYIPEPVGPEEAEFIAARDSFYMATVSETGWPYVQHRGGPAGFLRVLDEHRIGFADFRGNRQYLSVGNLDGNDRVALILMDYAARQRLKIWGRARIVHEADEAELVAQLEVPAYRARVERGIVITVEALDWNCPQHITPRFTGAEVEQQLKALREENAALRAQLAAGRGG